jgi:hypothetical protein
MYKNVAVFMDFLFSNLGFFTKKSLNLQKKSIILHKKGCKFQPLAIGCLMDPKGPKGKDQKKGGGGKHSPLGFDLVIYFFQFFDVVSMANMSRGI